MSRYIDTDVLEEVKDVMYDIFGNGMYAVRMSDVRELPTVYVPEGEWVTDEEFINCSNCKQERWSRIPYEELVKGFKYCPKCGARMKGKTE